MCAHNGGIEKRRRRFNNYFTMGSKKQSTIPHAVNALGNYLMS